jgi:hypothetical protein
MIFVAISGVALGLGFTGSGVASIRGAKKCLAVAGMSALIGAAFFAWDHFGL